MTFFCNILAQVPPQQPNTALDTIMLTLSVVGLLIFANWLIRLHPTRSLANCPIRRNNLPYYLPFLFLFTWLVATAAVASLIAILPQPDWLKDFYTYLGIAVLEIALIATLLLIARRTFARSLKGFGLNFRTAGKDIAIAAINYIAVFPFIAAVLALTIWLGQNIVGHNFQMQTNEGLTVLTENPRVLLRILLVFFIVVVVPAFEEMLFRGMLQSMIRGFVGKPWLAILVTSIIFVTLHPWMHWPALLILSCCMGYAYEKSGSILRPIFIHAIFNAVNITAALLS